jgi:hypothetical protein
VFLADQVACWPKGDLEHWLATGVLKPISPARSLPCLSCGGDHVGEVVFLDGAEPRQVRAYLPCPNCGPSPVELDDLRRWRVDIEQLIQTTVGKSVDQDQFSVMHANRLWRIGKAAGDVGNLTVFFGRQFHRQDTAAILQSARIPTKAVVLVPFHVPTVQCETLVLPLIDLVAENCQVNMTYLGQRLQEWLERRDPAGKRAPRKRTQRTAEIAALVAELREHLRTARDYALATRQQTGEAKLLPRPTQVELERRLGVSQCNVSRCLKDPDARELQFLWKLALDKERILAYSS